MSLIFGSAHARQLTIALVLMASPPVAAAVSGAVTSFTLPDGRSEQCRTAARPASSARPCECSIDNGAWQPAPAQACGATAVAVAPVPGAPTHGAPFRGMISTSGSYDGMMTSSRRVSKPRINLNEGLSLNNITGLISSASGPPKEHMTGALTVDLEFNGEQVKGRYQPNGKMNPGSFTGNVRDGVCTLYDDHDGAPWTGACGRNGFSGSVTSVANNPVQGTVNFQTSVIKIVDYDVRDREAAAVAAADKIASEKRAAAQLAAIRAMPLAGPVLTKQLNSFVIADSAGWVMNHYDAGTIHNVRVAEGSAKTGNMVLRGEYTFNGGESGWVLAKLVGGKLDCIQFWDARIGCRGLRDASYAAAVRGAAISAMSDSGGRGGYKGASDDEIQDGYIERRQNEMNARNNSPQQ